MDALSCCRFEALVARTTCLWAFANKSMHSAHLCHGSAHVAFDGLTLNLLRRMGAGGLCSACLLHGLCTPVRYFGSGRCALYSIPCRTASHCLQLGGPSYAPAVLTRMPKCENSGEAPSFQFQACSGCIQTGLDAAAAAALYRGEQL